MADPIVVVGAGVGGLRTCEALRAAGYAAELAVLGDEPHLPYQRPPLSKDVLAGTADLDGILLRRRKTVADVDWRLGRTATAASLDDRTVTVIGPDGEETLAWSGLVIATGLHPRRLDLAGSFTGAHALRHHADAGALRAQLRPGAHLVVIGAGFLGCEIAASAIGVGCTAEVVAPEQEPMQRPLGTLVGGALRALHEKAGVRFHLGRLPERIDRTEGGGALVRLDDGTELVADVVVEAVGSVPATGWLAGTGLDLTDGVLTDGWLRAVTEAGEARPDVVVVGDVARFPQPVAGGAARRIEHYDLPPLMARRAAPALLAGLSGGELDPAPFTPVPSFWSDQYDLTVQSFGSPELGDQVEIVSGSTGGPFVAAYRRRGSGGAGELVAAVGVGTMDGLMDLRSELTAVFGG